MRTAMKNCPASQGDEPQRGGRGAHTHRNNTGRIRGQHKRGGKRGIDTSATQHESFRARNTQFQGLKHPVPKPGTPSFKRPEHPVSNARNTQFQTLETLILGHYSQKPHKKRVGITSNSQFPFVYIIRKQFLFDYKSSLNFYCPVSFPTLCGIFQSPTSKFVKREVTRNPGSGYSKKGNRRSVSPSV